MCFALSFQICVTQNTQRLNVVVAFKGHYTMQISLQKGPLYVGSVVGIGALNFKEEHIAQNKNWPHPLKHKISGHEWRFFLGST